MNHLIFFGVESISKSWQHNICFALFKEDSNMTVTITESGQNYLKELLSKQDVEGIGIRMFVSNPGTSQAETCIAYCRPGEEQEGDEIVEYEAFTAYFEGRSLPFLKDAKVDYAADKMGGQLSIRAPNSKMPQVSDDSPIADRINYVLYNDVNPGLASHGGQVELEEFTDDGYAILKFGGGCQGCSAVDLTLKEGVEKTLIEKIPEIKGVRDTTDHSDTSNAYC
jgi:Fe/S biogenesis protein NfuA